MKKIEELGKDEILVIMPKGYDAEVMTCEEFLQSSYFIDKEKVEVTVANPMHAKFDLNHALESLEDEMFEGWLERVINDIPKDVRERIETEIDSYLEKEITYYPGEIVEW